MCGIIGYVGTDKTADILLKSLELLEYRGYDSSGVAFCSGKNVEVFKCPDRVSVLRQLTAGHGKGARAGIGHTRWATHGSVSYKNAHPHQSGQVTLVHNGIIENYKELTRTYHLEDILVSSGDSEVAAALLNGFYQGDPYAAIGKLVSIIKGTYALVILFADRPDEIYAIRKISPIVVAEKGEERMLASDLMPLADLTDTYFTLPEKTILKMDHDGISLRDLGGDPVEKKIEKLDWQIEQFDKKGYPFYMEKEITEQPEAIRATMERRIRDGLPYFGEDRIDERIFSDCRHIVIVACGTSYHAGLLSRNLFEKIAGIKTEVYVSSEFIYQEPLMEKDALVIVISQSGETIDTLEALRCCRQKGHPTLAIVNVKGSSIAMESDNVLYTDAGPEIAVASTKAYTCQLTALFLLVCRFALQSGKRNETEVRELVRDLEKVPETVRKVCEERETYRPLAARLAGANHIFMIGRNLDHCILLEAALKMKEITYIHTEAYASGELKHGPIALIEQDTPVIACLSQKDLLDKESSNIKEVRARGAKVYGFIKESLKDSLIQKIEVYPLKDLPDDLMVFSAITVFQILAYYVALAKGVNVDKPRNLAKVVTVE